MYRFHTVTSPEAAFHFLVSNLIHRGGWPFIDGRIAGLPVQSWPEPTDPVPVGLVDGDYLVTKAPDAVDAGSGDAIQLILHPIGPTIDLVLGRLNLGFDEAWDTVAHVFDGSTVYLTSSISIDSPELFLYASLRGLVIARLDATLGDVLSGRAMGYLETAVLRGTNTAPQLGAGDDPLPACQFNLNNLLAPPLLGVAFGNGEVFDEAGAIADADVVVQMWSQDSDELHDASIEFGGGVPVHVLTRCLVMQTPALDPGFLRGIFPNVFITSRNAAKAVLRVGFDDSEYVVIGRRVAVGPL